MEKKDGEYFVDRSVSTSEIWPRQKPGNLKSSYKWGNG